MYITRAEQIALDDALVAPANQLKIGKCNLRLSSDLKSKEATLQVVYDVLKLSPFFKAFQITTDVPEIYMQEEMLQICPKLPNQQFEELPFEEEILTFLGDLGHSGEIKVITDINVNKLHQPWRLFATVINKCLSGKSTRYDSLRLSQAQILWGMYHKKSVDYAYLLWEDFVYQVENMNVKRSNEMYYPRFTKVIVNFFMTKDSSIPRRNRVNRHFNRDDPMFTMIKIASRHKDTQLYGAILPDELTNEAIKYSESYKEHYAIASGDKPPKTKASVKKKQTGSDKIKTPPTDKGKRLKTSAKAAKPAKKKQPAKMSKAKGLTVLSEVALTEAEQMELATKRILIQTHSSHTNGLGTDTGIGNIPGVLDVPTYASDDEQISWKSSDEEDNYEVAMSGNDDDDADNQDDDDNDDDDNADNQDDDDNDDDDQNDDNIDNENDDNDDDDDDDGQDHEGLDDDNEQTDSDNDGDDFVYPKFSTHDEEDKEEDRFDLRVQTPYHYESINDEESNEVTHGANVEGEELDEEVKNEEDEANELYRDMNVNLEGRDTEMTDSPRTIIQNTQVIEDTHVIITPVNPEGQQQSSSVSSGFVSNMFNPSPDTGIDSIFNLNTESTSLVDVLVTTIAEPPLSSATTLPPPTIPLITHLQQTPARTPTTVPSSSLQDLPNFGSLFGLRDEAQAENEDFINKLDDNIKKIIKDKVKEQVKAQVSKILLKIEKTVNEQLKAKVLTRLSNKSKTSHVIAANLSELELKKILIDKMESNKSIHISDEHKNLYKALVDAYKSEKLILDTYGDTVSFKRRRDDEDKDEEPSTGSNRGSKRRRAEKEPESTSAPKEKTSRTTGKYTKGSKSHHKSTDKSAQAEEPMHTAEDLEEPAHHEFVTGDTKDKHDEDTSQHPDWFQKPSKPPTPDHDRNKTLPTAHGPIQLWLSTLAQKEDTRESFNELMDTSLDFSAIIMNRLKVDTLTPELLAEEVYKATTDQLDWINPEGQQYPHDLRKPLPLIPNSRGRQVIPFDHFINNDLEYLSGGVSSRKYATLVMKTKAADYGHIKWIEDLVPNRMWSQVPVSYDKHALWGISHWGRKRQQFYGFAVNRESARDVYSKRRIIAVTNLQIVEWHNYKHLDWITVRRDDDKLYKFKEGDFNRLRIQDIEDMLLLLVQGKLTNLTVEECLAFNVSLRISDLKQKEAYTAYSNPRGFIYQNKAKKNKLMRIDELYKFSNGTLNDVQTALNDRLKEIRMKYLP
ncbi:hypothetical protein Tco_0728488 [Tanacetum coccineum]|uniref:Uncharacterized protein n=1 Tax=Tanacetum coccineum TaxID=301880 RepID=A0ABQ4YNX7_9ASTR